MVDQNHPPIFDGHNDVLLKIHRQGSGEGQIFFQDQEDGHLDFPRARRANFRGGLFAVFPPNPASVPPPKDRLILQEQGYEVKMAPPLDYPYAQRVTREMIALLFQIEKVSGGKFQVVTSADSLNESFHSGVMTAVLHLEGAEAVQPDLDNLDEFYQLGMRSLGITWSRENAFGFGVPFKIPGSPDTGPGLKDPGKVLVKACNQLGVMIDLAHLNEKGFWDVAELTTAPLVSSHSAAHALIPRSRNLTDPQLRAIAETNGLVGVTFSVNDLDGGQKPKKDAPLSAVVRHVRYLVDLMGVDHVGFGSDLDGTTIPSRIKDVGGFSHLILALQEAGFQDEELRKICHQNWLRALGETWN